MESKRAILERVAGGSLSPDEAAQMLDAIASVPAGGDASSGVNAADPTEAPARKVRINAHLGQATVVGDADVRELHVDGPHSVRREGDTLIVDPEPMTGEGFFFDGGHARTWGRWSNTLHVRVNPESELWVSAQAGSVQVRNMSGPIHAEAQAGSVNIDGFSGPIELTTQAGSVRARGRLDRGASTIRCEAGSVRVQLLRGSSVQVAARSTMGQVKVEGALQEGGSRGRFDRLTIGDGAGTLDIETTMGSVKLEVEP